MERRPAVHAGGAQRVEAGTGCQRWVHEPDGRHHVCAGSKDAAEVIDVGVERRVVHAIGTDAEDLVDLVGRDDTGRWDASEVTGILPDLVGIRHIHADEFERWVIDEVADADLAARTGGPLHDAVRLFGYGVPRWDVGQVTHWPPLTDRCWPVTGAARSDAKNRTDPAHCSGVGIWRIGSSSARLR